MTTDTSVGRDGTPGLTAKETDSAETKISQLEVTVLVNEQVIWLQITGTNISSILLACRENTDRWTMPR